MKMNRITLGIGFGTYANHDNHVKEDAAQSVESQNMDPDLIAALIRLISEQKACMEQLHRELAEIKILLKEIKSQTMLPLKADGCRVSG